MRISARENEQTYLSFHRASSLRRVNFASELTQIYASLNSENETKTDLEVLTGDFDVYETSEPENVFANIVVAYQRDLA